MGFEIVVVPNIVVSPGMYTITVLELINIPHMRIHVTMLPEASE
jgi:hypothetical protein